MKKLIILYFLLSSGHLMLSAQLTYGTTGLLHVPSAEMQADGTVMFGGNFMNREITPPNWYYHTYNYFLNVTIFPWLEVAYTCTLFQSQHLGIDWKVGKGKYTNQDRYFSARVRALREGQLWKYMPGLVFGTSDPYTSTGEEHINTTDANGYYCRFYVAATKTVALPGSQSVGIHVSYLYNNRKDYPLNGLAAGLTYSPSFLPELRLVAEYDTKDFAAGFTYQLFKHLHIQTEMQQMKYFTGGLAYKVSLK